MGNLLAQGDNLSHHSLFLFSLKGIQIVDVALQDVKELAVKDERNLDTLIMLSWGRVAVILVTALGV
ncbi:hypothetical protein ColTof4_04696 [Colletotrichum tofieldiae]|nr:hypothetical protein ColTof3_11060 [Colletotrichum tofieldiae]GKT72273.1 hypothetical protein ColTof4_04696 [Colletotrichum tofieldiae]GKT89912.1 hypothetical protein Ct61P_07762 [Colletotrichum tofieldiae]